ncbi:hypothetical protein SLEP1_g39267 [Rubroshorea leprosula]|uniref:Uncharacterized protein n=1 Tax=Rubroshorea leprosula TaxID=152421 RepID=A0AAV5L0U1_9ROSI|nr:hypothetical protein SLEP1_g39267 [Rubroshorea leprosula]
MQLHVQQVNPLFPPVKMIWDHSHFSNQNPITINRCELPSG